MLLDLVGYLKDQWKYCIKQMVVKGIVLHISNEHQ